MLFRPSDSEMDAAREADALESFLPLPRLARAVFPILCERFCPPLSQDGQNDSQTRVRAGSQVDITHRKGARPGNSRSGFRARTSLV